MRLPFWEVSLFSQEPGQPAMIESIVCFSDSVAMRKYVHERRAESPTILLRTKYRTAIAPRQSPDTKISRVGTMFFATSDFMGPRHPKYQFAHILKLNYSFCSLRVIR